MRRVANLWRVTLAVLTRPDLWRALVSQARRMVPNDWYRNPLPSKDYLDYRGSAVYGMPLSQIPPHDVIRYLEWCKAFPGPIT